MNGESTCGHARGAECPRRHGGGLVGVAAKTKKSKRTIPLPPPVVKALSEHRKRQLKERLRAGDAYEDGDWVFADVLGRPIDPRRDWAAWKDLCKKARVPIRRVHDMRHTAATLLLAQGTDVRTVMAIMGWTQMRMADRYGHAVDASVRAAADRMGALWSDEGAG